MDKLLDSLLDKAPYMVPSLVMLVYFVKYVRDNVQTVRDIYERNEDRIKSLTDSCHLHQRETADAFAETAKEIAEKLAESGEQSAKALFDNARTHDRVIMFLEKREAESRVK